MGTSAKYLKIKDEVRDFKILLYEQNLTIKQFALDHKFNPAVFYAALNGSTAMKEEYMRAIREYTLEMKGELK